MNSADRNNRKSRSESFINRMDLTCVDNNEDDENYTNVLRLKTGNTNYENVRSCEPQKIVKDVCVQTDPEISDMYLPWLLEAESKTEDFCVQLTKLLDTFYQIQSKVKTKSKACPGSRIPVIKNIHSEKSTRPNINYKSSGYSKPDGGNEKPDFSVLFQLIEDRMQSMLKSAMKFKTSIPKVVLENLNSKQEYEVVKSTAVKETNVRTLEPSNYLVDEAENLPPQVYKIKSKTLRTVNGSKFMERRQTREHHGAGKSDNMYSAPKTKNVVNAKNTASGTSHPCISQTKQITPRVLRKPTKGTGALPKTTERRVTSASTTTRNQKTKKTNVKPLLEIKYISKIPISQSYFS